VFLLNEINPLNNNLVGVLLCGGKGERMKPFTLTNNKVMLQVGGKTLLDLHIEAFVSSKVKKILLICNSHINLVKEHVKKNYPRLEIMYFLEENPNGAINALKIVRDYLVNENVYLRFGDNYTSFDISKSINLSHENNSSINGAMVLTKYDDNPQYFGVCIFDNKGQIKEFIEKPNPSPSNIVLGGIYYFDRYLTIYMDKLSDKEKNYSIIDLLNFYNSESTVKDFRVDESGWIDCGTSEGLDKARLYQKECGSEL